MANREIKTFLPSEGEIADDLPDQNKEIQDSMEWFNDGTADKTRYKGNKIGGRESAAPYKS